MKMRRGKGNGGYEGSVSEGKNNEKIAANTENRRLKKKELDAQEKAEQDVVILLEGWKRKVRRYRIYRRCLFAALTLSCMALVGAVGYTVDSSIPSVINVRAGQKQSFRLGVPAKAEIISVNERGESNIPQGAVEIDLSRTVTMKASENTAYQMQVKLFGFLPIKDVDIRVIEDQQLIPVGMPVGIYVQTNGILIVGTGEFQGSDGMPHSPAKQVLYSGDYVREINGVAVEGKEDFVKKIEESAGEKLVMTVERSGELTQVSVKPMRDTNGVYKIGVWVRDNAQGVGTMTYIDAEGKFGALGHGVSDVDAGTLMHMGDGTLYETEIVGVEKGKIGEPGEITGMIVYSEEKILGEITHNSEKGIFGTCNDKALQMGSYEAMPIGLKQEIERGPARILSTVDGTTKYYDVEITAIHLDHDNVNRGIELTVTDPNLIEAAGGIVQGMSGSPILQNGRIVGAVTHVLINDPTKGYGIFIENMLEH